MSGGKRNGSHRGGNGTRPEGAAGEVLPFPAGGRGRRLRTDKAPPAEAQAPPQRTLPEQVAALAARGLSEEEIRLRLELSETLDEDAEAALAEAFRRGRLLGRARIKEAQFEAALAGRVTAQAQVLARLGELPGEEGGEAEGEQDGQDVEVVASVHADEAEPPPTD